jgi:hypothetical protein
MQVRPPTAITADHLETAKERFILARQTHLDSLVRKLAEPRARRVIEPVLAGTIPAKVDNVYQDDIAYVHDLGLIAPGNPSRIANPIYREVIARVLGAGIENGEILASGTDYTKAAAQLVFMAFLNRMVNGDGYIDREYAIGSGRTDILIRRPLRQRPAAARRFRAEGLEGQAG